MLFRSPGAPLPGAGRTKAPIRGESELRKNSEAYFAQAKIGTQLGVRPADLSDAKPGPIVAPVAVHIGPMRPRWIADETGTQHLFLLRSVKLGTRIVYQGVLVDWVKLQAALKAEIADIFPAAELHPAIATDEPVHERTMTALPVRLDTEIGRAHV